MIVSNRNYKINHHPLTSCMHVLLLFLESNDKATCKNDKTHGRKLQMLIPNFHEESIIDQISHDPNKVIYNF